MSRRKGATPTARRARRASPRIFRSCGEAESKTLFTRKTLRSNAQDHRGEHHDRQAAENGAPERADQHLRPAQDNGRDGKADERGSGYEDEHEGVDEPRHAHIGTAAQKRLKEPPGGARQPRPTAKAGKAHEPVVDAEPAPKRF